MLTLLSERDAHTDSQSETTQCGRHSRVVCNAPVWETPHRSGDSRRLLLATHAPTSSSVDFGEVFEAGEGFVDVIGLSIVASLELYEVKKWKGKWSTFRGTRLGAISFTNIGNHCQRRRFCG